MITLSRSEWMARRTAHEARIDGLLTEHRRRSSRGIKHPVEDFLFEYYTFRPYQLRRWQPGHGVALADADEWVGLRDYMVGESGVHLDTKALLARRGRTVTQMLGLLRATRGRRPSFGCFGMHEWAMVDGLEPAQTRHPQLGLRLAPRDISATLREVGVRCTHVDAYRFFTPSAVPLNEVIPTRENQVDVDQPGCLHVGMDLYKIATKLSPLIDSDLIADCFELAHRIRVLDMRASPYDVSAVGLTPVAVETAEGRRDYVAAQRAFAAAAAPLRERLLVLLTAIADRPDAGP